MVTPTMSVRALPEHHQLIRRMARALMERPDLAESLTALIEGVVQDVTQGVTRPEATVDQRFEDIERRLAQVEGQGVLRGEDLDVLLATQDVLQPIRERLDNAEEFLQRLMNMAENINDRVKDLERPEDPQRAATQPAQHKAVTQRPRPPAKQGAGGGKEPTERDLRIADMLKAGQSYREIAKAVGGHHGALTRIRKRLERQGLVTADDQPEQPAEADPPSDT